MKWEQKGGQVVKAYNSGQRGDISAPPSCPFIFSYALLTAIY